MKTEKATAIDSYAVLEQDRQLAWAQGLYQIGQTITHEKSEHVQQKLLEHIVTFFEADSGCIALLDETGGALNIVAGSGSAAEFVGAAIKVGDGVLGWVAQEKQPLLLDGEVANDPRFKNLQPRKQDSRPVSALCWPLTMDSELIGAISINRRDRGVQFGHEDLRQGDIIVGFVSPVVGNIRLYQEQRRRTEELQASNQMLQEAQNQLLQSEKMASIGQLAAGVAHEINNPVGYINSNLGSLGRYLEDLFRLLDAYEQAEAELPDCDASKAIAAVRQEVDTVFLRQDISDLMNESREGITRVKQIVQDLKDFSHVDEGDWQWSDLHNGLDSTLNIVNHELKYKAEVVREYGELPQVMCIASQLNQVFMNLLVNAAHAIEGQGVITIRTGREGDDRVWVEISDTGKGMAPDCVKRIFDPFYTTKPVGMGTGLGLSLSYSIVQKHAGRIEVESEEGKGTSFRIWLPVEAEEDTTSDR